MRALTEQTGLEKNVSAMKRWNLCQRLSAEFWSRWSREYLHLLQRYYKWKHPKRSIQKGDVVLLKDQELFTRSWPLACVEETHPGKDGLVRVVSVRTEKGIYLRPITKLVPLYKLGYVKRGSTAFKVQKDGCGVLSAARALLVPEGLLMR